MAAVSDKPWSEISPSDYEDADDYCGACLIDQNEPGSPKIRSACKLPVYEPRAMGRALNRNAVHAAASVLAGGRGGVNATEAEKVAARKKLRALYETLGEEPPESLAMANDDELATEDFMAVEILAAGGPYFGHGSPRDGDRFTEDDLRAIAEANAALADEIRIPLKIGHSPEQKLLRRSGLADDEQPAAGWVENLRVEGGKLLADLRRVPSKLAALIRAGAFRTRSVEMRPYERQDGSGKRFPLVVTGLALLGAKAPAVRTLDDIVALYADWDWTSGDEPARCYYVSDLSLGSPPGAVGFVWPSSATGTAPGATATVTTGTTGAFTRSMSPTAMLAEIAWDETSGMRWIEARLNEALNPRTVRIDEPSTRYGIVDIRPDAALVEEYDRGVYWIVPYRVVDRAVEVAPMSDWTLAQKQWVEAAKMSMPEVKFGGGGADRRDDGDRHNKERKAMLELTLNESAVRDLGSVLGLGETYDADALVAKVREVIAEASQPGRSLTEDEYATLLADARAGREAKEELRVTTRDRLIDDAIREGKIDPAARDEFVAKYDESPDAVIWALAHMRPDESRRVYGSDEARLVEAEREASDRAFAEIADRLGIPIEERA